MSKAGEVYRSRDGKLGRDVISEAPIHGHLGGVHGLVDSYLVTAQVTA